MTRNNNIVHMKTQNFMALAYEQALKAAENNEVPVGAVLVDASQNIVAKAHNEMVKRGNPTAHAEMRVIEQACQALGVSRLAQCTLYVTLEPCAMCAQAISLARIPTLYYGAYDPKSGAVDHGPYLFQQNTCHHFPEVYGGIMGSECGALLTKFFQEKRKGGGSDGT